MHHTTPYRLTVKLDLALNEARVLAVILGVLGLILVSLLISPWGAGGVGGEV
jgi:hypothetical protein